MWLVLGCYTCEAALRCTHRSGNFGAQVKHHPKSVNNLLVKQLLDRRPGTSLARCLHSEFACISKALSERLVGSCGWCCSLSAAVSVADAPTSVCQPNLGLRLMILRAAI